MHPALQRSAVKLVVFFLYYFTPKHYCCQEQSRDCYASKLKSSYFSHPDQTPEVKQKLSHLKKNFHYEYSNNACSIYNRI